MRDPFSIKLIALRDAIYEPTDDNVSHFKTTATREISHETAKKKT